MNKDIIPELPVPHGGVLIGIIKRINVIIRVLNEMMHFQDERLTLFGTMTKTVAKMADMLERHDKEIKRLGGK